MREVTEAVLALLQTGGRGALATVVASSGSVPQRAGARLLLRDDGSSVGTIGGGAIEQQVLGELREVLAHGQARMLRRDLTRDLGMCCGGHMEIFLEPVHAPPRLSLFGAGHVAVPTAQLALSVGFDVHVVDEREELLTSERFPGCRLHPVDAASYCKRHAFHAEHDWVLIVTHDHQLDEDILGLAVARPHAYIGLVGSRRKVLRLVDRVQARQGPAAQALSFERVYAPVGLDLGALTPQEIAVSIVAEWVALRRGKQGRHLSVLRNAGGATGSAA
ncbi:MAG TPA: XdhC family protein [Polyangiaceae bacterium]|nr:XdhC family protein [Polyangiaceae bacterium]